MSILSSCTKDRVSREKFINFVEEVVSDGAREFDSLCLADKREMTALLINALDDKADWLVESNKVDITLHFLTKYMTLYSNDNKEDLVEAIQDQAISYFSNRLNEYVEEIYGNYHRENNRDYYKINSHLIDREYINGTDYRR